MTENDRVFLEISLELLRQGCRVRFRPGGQSMHPTIKDGEAILVEPANPAQIKRGDIILYRFERGVIAHRVKNIPSSDTFITRGDSSFTDDQPVPLNDVLGRVVAVERNGRAVALVGQAARWRRIGRILSGWLKGWLVKR
jgi:signal peptidase